MLCDAVVRRMQTDRAANREWADDERFPGDAATMLEKNREEVPDAGLAFDGRVDR